MTTRPRPSTRPQQGSGHYSADGRRWFDDAEQCWFPVLGEQDTLTIELEDVNAASWWAGILATLASPMGTAYSRFVGHATSTDPRWPAYRVESPTFPRVRGIPDSIAAEETWSPGMTEALNALRHRLEEEGWRPVGRGDKPWAYTYRRPHVDRPQTSTPR